MEKEKSRKIKNKMRLERSGDGDTCVEEKKQEKKKEKKRKRRRNVWMQGKERRE